MDTPNSGAPSAEEIEKSLALHAPHGSGRALSGHTPVPKSWFASPYEMLSDIGLDYQQQPSGVTYATLRQMWRSNMIVQNVVLTRQNQCAGFAQPQQNEYSIGFAVQHKDHKHHKYTQSDRHYQRKMREFVLNCGFDDDDDRDDFETFIRKIVYDRLVLDQVCIEKIPNHFGEPSSFHAIDGGTVRLRRRKNQRNRPLTDAEARGAVRYVQLIDGQIVTEYTRDQLIFAVANPRTDIGVSGYGWSELEALITTITFHLFGEQWNQKVFSQGSTIKGMLNLKGNIPPTQLEAFKRQWLTQVAGVGNSWRTPIFNADDVEWIPLQPSNMDMGYEQWMNYLIKQITGAYLMDPAEINFDMRGGAGSQQPMFMTTNEAQQKISKDRGLQPLLRFIAKIMNRYILKHLNPDWEFVFKGLDAKSEEQAIELNLKEAGAFKTVNEVRAEHGLPPIEAGDMVANPTLVSYVQTQQQMKQAEVQQSQMAAQQGQQPGQQPQAAQGQSQQPGAMPPPAQGADRLARYQNADQNMAALLGGDKQAQPPGGLSKYDPVGGHPDASPFPKKKRADVDTETAAAGAALEQEAAESSSSSSSSGEDHTDPEWESTIHASSPNSLIKALTGTAAMLRRLG